MVSRIIYNGSRVSNMHLCVTIAFQDRLRRRRDDCHLPQLGTPCPSLRIKAPNYIGMNKAPENLYCSGRPRASGFGWPTLHIACDINSLIEPATKTRAGHENEQGSEN